MRACSVILHSLILLPKLVDTAFVLKNIYICIYVYICVYKQTKKEQCIAESLAAVSDSTRSLHRCIISQVLIHSCSITNPMIVGMGCLRPVLGPAAQRWSLSLPFPGWLQDNAEPVSYLINN